jgi:urease accessory protein
MLRIHDTRSCGSGAARWPGWCFAAASMVALCWPGGAAAHTASAAEGFMSGLKHPVFGPDHFLAMLSVGIVSTQLGGRHIFVVPAVFVAAMVVGAVFGIYGFQWPGTEAGIAFSVVTLGVAIFLVKDNRQRWLIMAVTALFGSLHGHAHGLEMPRAADPVFYGAGFLVGTTAIHLLGVLIGHFAMARPSLTRYLRLLGAGIAIAGLVFVVGLI